MQKKIITYITAIVLAGFLCGVNTARAMDKREYNARFEVFSISEIDFNNDWVIVHYYGDDEKPGIDAASLTIFFVDESKNTVEEIENSLPGLENNILPGTWVVRSGKFPKSASEIVFYRVNNKAEMEIGSNASGVLFYSLGVEDGTYIYGKADYRSCMKSEYYATGATCRLEKSESGDLYYWPYINGVRQGPEEEPREVDVADSDDDDGANEGENSDGDDGANGEEESNDGEMDGLLGMASDESNSGMGGGMAVGLVGGVADGVADGIVGAENDAANIDLLQGDEKEIDNGVTVAGVTNESVSLQITETFLQDMAIEAVSDTLAQNEELIKLGYSEAKTMLPVLSESKVDGGKLWALFMVIGLSAAFIVWLYFPERKKKNR